MKICTRDGTVLEAEATNDPQVGKVLDGKYRLDAFLSQGGMGAVYKATHVMLGRPVAVKLIKPELVTSPDIVRRFQREARAASNLNHPNIVNIFDLGQTDDGTLYIAMELIDGPSLKDVIRKTGPLPAPRTIRILRQIAGALSVAHRNGIIHRDLKPHNVMLARDGEGNEVAKLLDFGIAKTFDEAAQLTQTGFALGTPQYMSPEQAEGKPVDGRSDLYSVGVILYELLAGEVPFNDSSTPAILVKQMTEAPTPPSFRNPSVPVPPQLEAIAMRCLEKDPANRFQTAEDLSAALDRAGVEIAAAHGSDQPTLLAPSASAPTLIAPTRPDTRPTVTGAPVPLAATVASVAAGPVSTRPVAAASTTAASVPSPSLPEAQTPVSMPPVPQASASGGSNTALIVIAAIVVLALVVGGAMQLGYMPWQRQAATPGTDGQTTMPSAAPATTPATAAASPAPSGTPASAQTGTPAPPSPASASSQATSAASPNAIAAPNTSSVRATTATTPPPTGAPSDPPGRAQRGGVPSAQTAAAAPTPVPAQPPAALPQNPRVFFRCMGAPDVCGAVGTAMESALERDNMPSVRAPDRAEIMLTANATALEERVTQQFGTTFATRTFSVGVSGEARGGDAVPMPPARTFSFDAQFGRERLPENARLISDDVVEKVRAFWKKRTSSS